MNDGGTERAERAPTATSAWRRWGSAYLAWAFRVTLGVVFVAAAVPKIAVPEQFARSIANYHLVPHGAVNVMAICFPWVELLSGLAVIAGVATRANLLIIVALLVAFSAAIGSALYRGLDISCGCFSGGQDAQSMTQWTLLWDIIWIAMGVFALVFDRGKLSISRWLFNVRSAARG